MSSIHGIGHRFYSTEQLHAWAPATYDEEAWKQKMVNMQPFVAVVGGRLAGYTDLQASGYIDHFFVSADCSGQGIGSALMQHLHDMAIARGIWGLSAHVSLSAEAFFARHGFQIEARRTAVVNGFALQNASMYKTLEPSSR